MKRFFLSASIIIITSVFTVSALRIYEARKIPVLRFASSSVAAGTDKPTMFVRVDYSKDIDNSFCLLVMPSESDLTGWSYDSDLVGIYSFPTTINNRNAIYRKQDLGIGTELTVNSVELGEKLGRGNVVLVIDGNNVHSFFLSEGLLIRDIFGKKDSSLPLNILIKDLLLKENISNSLKDFFRSLLRPMD